MAFWRSRQKSIPELCKTTRDLLTRIGAEAPQQKLDEEIARNLNQMKVTLQGTAGKQRDAARTPLTTLTANSNE